MKHHIFFIVLAAALFLPLSDAQSQHTLTGGRSATVVPERTVYAQEALITTYEEGDNVITCISYKKADGNYTSLTIPPPNPVDEKCATACPGGCGKGKVCRCVAPNPTEECSCKCAAPPIQNDDGDCDPLGGNCG